MIGTRFRIDTAIAGQAALSARVARGQADIATGKRLQRASDDPAASARLSQLRRKTSDIAAWRSAADGAAALAARADSALTSVASALDRAHELTVAAASDTLSASDRAAIGAELNGLAEQIDSLSRETDAGGQPVFPDTPLQIRVRDALTLSATSARADAFTAGGTDIATTLRNTAAAVSGDTATRASAIAAVAVAAGHVSAVRGEQGVRAQRIDAIVERLTDSATANEEERASLADTDIAATIAHVQADSLALSAAQAAFARVNRSTLFDLLG